MPEPADHPRNSVGILAYGSLIADPGVEIGPLIDRRIDTLTHFPWSTPASRRLAVVGLRRCRIRQASG